MAFVGKRKGGRYIANGIFRCVDKYNTGKTFRQASIVVFVAFCFPSIGVASFCESVFQRIFDISARIPPVPRIIRGVTESNHWRRQATQINILYGHWNPKPTQLEVSNVDQVSDVRSLERWCAAWAPARASWRGFTSDEIREYLGKAERKVFVIRYDKNADQLYDQWEDKSGEVTQRMKPGALVAVAYVEDTGTKVRIRGISAPTPEGQSSVDSLLTPLLKQVKRHRSVMELEITWSPTNFFLIPVIVEHEFKTMRPKPRISINSSRNEVVLTIR